MTADATTKTTNSATTATTATTAQADVDWADAMGGVSVDV